MTAADDDPRRRRTPADLHDDDELAAAIAAQIESFTSTSPLPIVRPQDDPRRSAVQIPPPVSAQPAATGLALPTPPPAPEPAVEAPQAAEPEPEPEAEPTEPEPMELEPEPEPQPEPEPEPEPESEPQLELEPEPEAPALSSIALPPTELINTRRARRLAVPQYIPSDPLDATGPIPIPPSLYADWEQQLRSIGRPADQPVAASSDVAAASDTARPIDETPDDVAPDEEISVDDAVAEIVPLQDVAVEEPSRDEVRVEPVTDAEADAAEAAIVVASSEPEEPVVVAEPMSDDAEPVVVVARSAPGFLSSFIGWITVFVSPLTVLGGVALAVTGAATPLESGGAVMIGLLLGAPGLARAAGAWGGPAVHAQQVLGRPIGVALVILQILARIGAICLALLALGDLATGFGERGVLGSIPTASIGVIAAAIAGVVGAILAIARFRPVTVVLGVVGTLGMLLTAFLLAMLASASGLSGRSGDGSTAIAAGGVALGALALAVGVPRARGLRAGTAGTRVGRAVGATLAAVAGGAVLVVASLAAQHGALTLSAAPTDALVSDIVDATASQLALPIAIGMLVAITAVVALIGRATGDLVAALAGTVRPAGPAGGGAVLVGLAAAAAALAFAVDPVAAVARFAPILVVPLAAWLGTVATAPLRASALRGRVVAAIGLLVATAAGLLLVDGLVLSTERSPVFFALGLAADSPWRASPAIAFVVATVVGAIFGALATAVSSAGAQEDRDWTIGVAPDVAPRESAADRVTA